MANQDDFTGTGSRAIAEAEGSWSGVTCMSDSDGSLPTALRCVIGTALQQKRTSGTVPGFR